MIMPSCSRHMGTQLYLPAAGFLLLLTSLLDAFSGYAAVRVLTAPFIWLGTNSLAVFAGDIMLQARTLAISMFPRRILILCLGLQ